VNIYLQLSGKEDTNCGADGVNLSALSRGDTTATYRTPHRVEPCHSC
jgi:hypothetical protein